MRGEGTKKGSIKTPEKLKFVLNILKNMHEALDGMNIIILANICVGEFLRVSSFYERLNLTNKIILATLRSCEVWRRRKSSRKWKRKSWKPCVCAKIAFLWRLTAKVAHIHVTRKSTILSHAFPLSASNLCYARRFHPEGKNLSPACAHSRPTKSAPEPLQTTSNAKFISKSMVWEGSERRQGETSRKTLFGSPCETCLRQLIFNLRLCWQNFSRKFPRSLRQSKTLRTERIAINVQVTVMPELQSWIIHRTPFRVPQSLRGNKIMIAH